MSTPQLFAWAVRHRLYDDAGTVNHTSRGGAVAEYMRDMRDIWPDVKFTDFRVRKLGPAVTSDRLRRVAKYRGTPWAVAGARVLVIGERGGYIVDGNSSANFDVLLDDGCIVNCHPLDVRPEAAGPAGAAA